MNTILIVDDMAIFREPIAAALRQKGYETDCAPHGKAALKMLQTRKPHLILLDVAMPEMDGLTFLKTIRADSRYRDLPVILLTAVAERDYVVQASRLGISDYLLKSQFSLAEMLSRVEKQLARQAVTQESVPAAESTAAPETQAAPTAPCTRPDVLERVRRRFRLEGVPPVMGQVLALVDNPASNLDEIARAIRMDQALAIRVMRVANSAFYTRGRAVHDLTEAAQRLGTAGVRNIVLTISTMDHLADIAPSGLVPQRYWEHSLGVAVLAQELARRILPGDAEHLFLAGLLHDLGRIVMASLFPIPYRAALDTARRTNQSLESAERDAFGISHSELTSEVLTQWNIPAPLIEAAALHARPVDRVRAKARDPRRALIVALANRLAHAVLSGDSGGDTLLDLGNFAEALSLEGSAVEAAARESVSTVDDTHIFFASRGNASFLPPLRRELIKPYANMRVGVVGRPRHCEAITLFLEQVGWLNADDPSVAIVVAGSAEQLAAQSPSLHKWDRRDAGPIPTLIVSPSPEAVVPALQGRRCASLALPARYAVILDTVARLGAAEAASA